jgi:Flp pilus assembly protein TadG
VEFAIVLPVFLTLVLGIIELGRGLMVCHLLTNAARQGCRVGVLQNQSTAAITTAVNRSLTAMGITNDAVTVLVNNANTDAAGARSGDEITVSVSVPVGSVTWLPGGKYLSGSLRGQFTLRRE